MTSSLETPGACCQPPHAVEAYGRTRLDEMRYGMPIPNERGTAYMCRRPLESLFHSSNLLAMWPWELEARQNFVDQNKAACGTST